MAHRGSTTASCTASSLPHLSLLKLSSVTPPKSSKVVSRNLHTQHNGKSVARLSRKAHEAAAGGGAEGAHFGATILSRSAPLVYFFSPYSWPPKKASGSAGAARARFFHCASPCLPRSSTCGQSLKLESLDTLIIIARRYSNDGQPLSW